MLDMQSDMFKNMALSFVSQQSGIDIATLQKITQMMADSNMSLSEMIHSDHFIDSLRKIIPNDETSKIIEAEVE